VRLSIIRGGGFGGLVKTTTLDTDTLSPDEAQEVVARIEEADLFGLPLAAPAGPGRPDQSEYVITVEDGARRHEVQVSEYSIPEQLRSVIK